MQNAFPEEGKGDSPLWGKIPFSAPIYPDFPYNHDCLFLYILALFPHTANQTSNICALRGNSASILHLPYLALVDCPTRLSLYSRTVHCALCTAVHTLPIIFVFFEGKLCPYLALPYNHHHIWLKLTAQLDFSLYSRIHCQSYSCPSSLKGNTIPLLYIYSQI